MHFRVSGAPMTYFTPTTAGADWTSGVTGQHWVLAQWYSMNRCRKYGKGCKKFCITVASLLQKGKCVLRSCTFRTHLMSQQVYPFALHWSILTAEVLSPRWPGASCSGYNNMSDINDDLQIAKLYDPTISVDKNVDIGWFCKRFNSVTQSHHYLIYVYKYVVINYKKKMENTVPKWYTVIWHSFRTTGANRIVFLWI